MPKTVLPHFWGFKKRLHLQNSPCHINSGTALVLQVKTYGDTDSESNRFMPDHGTWHKCVSVFYTYIHNQKVYENRKDAIFKYWLGEEGLDSAPGTKESQIRNCWCMLKELKHSYAFACYLSGYSSGKEGREKHARYLHTIFLLIKLIYSQEPYWYNMEN